jgi:hypothetical protein
MLLHGLWDFSTFAVSRGAPGALAPFGSLLNYVASILALIFVVFVIRGADERIKA